MSDSDSDQDDQTLNTKSQLFLQAAITRRFFPETDAIEMHKRCCQIVGSEEGDFAEFIEQITKAIEPFGFNLKKRGAESDGKPWYALANVKMDQVSQAATDLKAEELAFFKDLVEAIMEAPNLAYCIRVSKAYEIASTHKISKSAAQSLLASLVLKGWLHRDVETNIYSLSTRSLLELENFLVTQYETELEGAECDACKELVFEGAKCPNADCDLRSHAECRKSRARTQPNCSNCQTLWPANAGIPIGIRALTLDNRNGSENTSPAAGSSRTSNGTAKASARSKASTNGRATRRNVIPASGDDDDEDELDEEFSSAVRDLDTQLDRSTAVGTSEA